MMKNIFIFLNNNNKGQQVTLLLSKVVNHKRKEGRDRMEKKGKKGGKKTGKDRTNLIVWV